MKKLGYVLIMIFALSCAASKNTAQTDLDGNWQLTVFPSATKTFTEIFGDRKPELRFDSAGRVSGTTGCNRLMGNYNAGRKNKLTFGTNMAVTKMACPGYEENIFLDALYKVNRYKVNENQLELWNDSTLIMTFTKE